MLGCNSLNISTAVSPSEASPHISQSGFACKTVRSERRTSSLSSTTKNRVRITDLSCVSLRYATPRARNSSFAGRRSPKSYAFHHRFIHGDGRDNDCAVVTRLNIERAPELAYTLTHPAQSHAMVCS